MSAPVAIIDSGGANLASLLFALERLGSPGEVTSSADEIRSAERVILPGVGSAAAAMNRLREFGLIDVIRDLVQPVLGICLGMQLLGDASEEENTACLGIIPGTALKLDASRENPVPNMGWCRTRSVRPHPLLADTPDDTFFYFVHSYAFPVSDATIAESDHARPFSAAIAHDNFVAAQFHPERSAAAGARVLRNFLEWRP